MTAPKEPPPGDVLAAESAKALAARLLGSGLSPTQVSAAFLAVAAIVSGRGRREGDDTDLIASMRRLAAWFMERATGPEPAPSGLGRQRCGASVRGTGICCVLRVGHSGKHSVWWGLE